MWDSRRFGGIAAASAMVLACLAAFRLVAAASPRSPGWIEANDWAVLEFPARGWIGGQLSGAVKCGEARDRRIGILLGSSYQVYDIDVPRLQALSRPTRRWLPLTMLGCTPVEFLPTGRLVLEAGEIRPDIAVITVAPKSFAHADTYRSPDLDELNEADPAGDPAFLSRAPELREAVRSALRWLRPRLKALAPDRTRINFRLRYRVAVARTGMLAALGQGIVTDFPPRSDPAAGVMGDINQAGSAERILLTDRRCGAFDPAAYSRYGPAGRALIELTERLHAAGATVVLVVMPESTAYRSALVPEARKTMDVVLAEARTRGASRILDLETFARDDEFLDLHHLGAAGRERFTRRLADELSQIDAYAATDRGEGPGPRSIPGDGRQDVASSRHGTDTTALPRSEDLPER